MSDSIFTRIIRGEIPSHRIYEDSDHVGFLDIHPIQPGHTLIVTKKQVDDFTDLDDDAFANLMKVSQRVAKHIKKITGCSRVVVRIEGFDVPHVHVHLIPCNHEHDSYRAGRDAEEPDHLALRAMAEKLRIEN